MKKSFLLYIDALEVLNVLTDEQAGQLFKAIRAYHLGIEFESEPIIQIAMASFIQNFKRDNEKYLMIVERNRANGLKNSKLKHETQKTQPNPVGSTRTHSKPLVTDNDNDNDNGNDKENEINKKNKQKKIEPPTLEEVKAWFIDQGSTAEQGAKAWQYYTDGNWHDAKGQPVKNWRQKMRGGRWLEVKAPNTVLTHSENGITYQNLSNETPNNYPELNDFFTAE
jgi:hypothetical protein